MNLTYLFCFSNETNSHFRANTRNSQLTAHLSHLRVHCQFLLSGRVFFIIFAASQLCCWQFLNTQRVNYHVEKVFTAGLRNCELIIPAEIYFVELQPKAVFTQRKYARVLIFSNLYFTQNFAKKNHSSL